MDISRICSIAVSEAIGVVGNSGSVLAVVVAPAGQGSTVVHPTERIYKRHPTELVFDKILIQDKVIAQHCGWP